MINVNKTYLPPAEEYEKLLKRIWENNQLTNNGPLVQELEDKLKKHLGVKHLFLVANGTVALQIAIKALALKGEVITSPFTFLATTTSLIWEGCEPIFADIQKNSLTIDPIEIEKRITPNTSAILGVHVYGNPCEVERIKELSEKYDLPVIYDAAHAFGVKYKGESLLNYGDISTLSFHATKVFHTVEGGAVITNDDDLAHRISYMRNFGQEGPEKFWGVGINAKNSEFHAAMGLCILPQIDGIIARRRVISELYDSLLDSAPGISKPLVRAGAEYNFSFYPVILPSEEALLDLQSRLSDEGVFTRRYFYPSLNTLDYVTRQEAPVSEDISRRILCLPFYYDLPDDDVIRIANIICGKS
ncbi:DegT/DnrJ/EryC1/StrS family aminotransferase [Candidatus Falkowbacteria bacterium]|nr:DegT/DnrJ/EryC1/StrS family aminotransferase [Candidatus Falkowbacteria bacterium]